MIKFSKSSLTILLCLTFFSTILTFSFFTHHSLIKTETPEVTLFVSSDLRTSVDPIYIDQMNSTIDWEWASSNSWCKGSGTYADPYMLENLIIDGNGAEYGIKIENSNAIPFIIHNCIVFNVSFTNFSPLILINNCSDGIISNNEVFSGYKGIHIFWSSENMTIINNYIHGFKKQGSDPVGIYLSNNCVDNLISGNLFDDCYTGVYLYNLCSNNSLCYNQMHNISDAGFHPALNCDENEFFGNIFYESQGSPVKTESNIDNVFYNNCFFDYETLTLATSVDFFNNSITGNYWGDLYTCWDNDHDGFADNPLEIDAPNYDYKALMNYAPILINSPEDETFDLGTEGEFLVWRVLDDSVIYSTYDLYINGKLVSAANLWNSGIDIEIPIDIEVAGDYIYEIVFDDGNGAISSDAVVITISTNDVTNEPNTFELIMDTLDNYSFLIGCVILSISLIISAIIKKPKQKSDIRNEKEL